MQHTVSSITQKKFKITQWHLEQAYRLLGEVHRDIGENYFVMAAFSPGPNGVSKPVQYFYAQSPDEAMPFVKKYAPNHHIYYSVAWQSQKKPQTDENGKRKLQRGGKKDCIGGSVLWVELDYDHPLKTEGKDDVKYPKDYEEIKNILAELPAPSVVISSGHGAHLIWLLIQPMTVEEHSLHTDNSLPAQWQRTIGYYYEKLGYTKPDSTHAIDRILRMPGTYNLKELNNPVLCHIMEEESTWVRYDIEYLKRFIVPEAVAEAHNQVVATVATVTIGEIEQSIELDPDAEPPKEKFEELLQNEKFQMLWNLEDSEKGNDLSAYDMGLTLMALRRGWTYQEIANLLIAFRREHIGEFDEERINKPWSRSDYIPRTIANAEAELAKNSKVIALPNRGREAGQDGQAQVSGNLVLFPEASRQEKTLKDLLPDIPEDVANLKMPANWDIQNGMLTYLKPEKDGSTTPMKVSQPVFISRLINRKDGGMGSKVELLFWDCGKWKRLLANRSTVFSSQKIVSLADQGLHVTSESGKNVVRFLDAFLTNNQMDIPCQESINHLGWVDKDFKTFIASPDNLNGLYLDIDEGIRKYVDALHEYGTLDGWIEGMKTYVKADEDGQPVYPIARAVIDSYFASPLLPIIKQRPFTIHVYSNTGGGKTATAKLGASIWGNPEELKITLNSTQYFLEQISGVFKHIPMFLDELQSVERNRQSDVAERFLYTHAQGQGKGRGSKNGGVREMFTWCNIANTTGERALTTDKSQGGAKNRALELFGKPLPDTRLASKAHIVAETNYGHAGKVFIQHVIETGVEEIRRVYREMTEQIMDLAEENSMQHIHMISAIALADFLVSQWLFGKTPDKAILEATNLAKYLISNIESSANIDDSTRAKLFVEEWLFTHNVHFDPSSYKFREKPYGNVTKDEIYVLPNVLNKALEDEGFEPTRIMRDWKEKGWIKTGEGKHLTMLKTLRMNWDGTETKRQRVYVLKKDEFMH